MTYPTTFSWINPKLETRQSLVDGEGMFANDTIKKDEPLIVQGGRCMHLSDIDAIGIDNESYLGFQVDEQIYILPLIVDGELKPDGIFKTNHSCEPNAGFKGQIMLVAMRDIAADEEINFDYAMTDVEFDGDITWNKTNCTCGTPTCRKQITGHDWKRPELQERYQGYFSTYVTETIVRLQNNQ